VILQIPIGRSAALAVLATFLSFQPSEILLI
jgi:hypothetical protein